MTDYHLDQWIRLWLLGEEPEQKFNPDPNKIILGTNHYEYLIRKVFTKSKPFLRDEMPYCTYELMLENFQKIRH